MNAFKHGGDGVELVVKLVVEFDNLSLGDGRVGDDRLDAVSSGWSVAGGGWWLVTRWDIDVLGR